MSRLSGQRGGFVDGGAVEFGMVAWCSSGLLAVAFAAFGFASGCSSEAGDRESADGGSAPDGARESACGDAVCSANETCGSCEVDCGVCSRDGAEEWIRAHFADEPMLVGDFTSRQRPATPVLVADSTATSAKYAFDLQSDDEQEVVEAGFVNVQISNLESADRFGGGIYTANAPGAVLYIADVDIEPNWPSWISYDQTNSDGMVLDNSLAVYAENLAIRNWNSDAALDIKSEQTQFVALTTEGKGHRTLRYWKPGPHYLVDSSISNRDEVGEGSLVWGRDCDTLVIRVFNTTFNGASTLPEDKLACDDGSNPSIEYLAVDPRTTGEMHEMFTAP